MKKGIIVLSGLLVMAAAIYFFIRKRNNASEISKQEITSDSAKNWWYKSSIIYNVDVEKFKDSDSDGIGDFKGLTQKLSYLKSLGFTAIWLSPFQPTPNLDDGYDISDFYGVDKRLGTMEDFEAFMHAADSSGIRVIMDMVVNHTSDSCSWFMQAEKDTNSAYHNWYVWSKEKPKNYDVGMVFPGVQKEIWSYDTIAKEYYYHRFYKFQPDLNMQNPEVQAEVKKIMKFWLDKGMSGFRMDAVPFIIEVPQTEGDKFPLQYELITDLRNYIQSIRKDAIILGEAIAIVKDDSVVMMKGFGVRDIETKEPVDENTLFMIASNSKLFTGTAIAQLDYDKKLSLDDKITKYFPWFRVYDSTTTQLVTIKDMLGHHLGTKTFQGDFTFWNSNFSRDSVLYKMRFVKPPLQFRASYGYCNSCFLTAGHIIQQVTNKPWEVYVYDSIVAPLQMTNTHTLGAGMINMPDAATPYTTAFTNTLTKLPYDNIDNFAPAGSIVSNVKDLTHWLKMQLDSGRYNGKQILPWDVLQKTRGVNTLVSTKKNSMGGHFVAYGLGVFIRDMNGKQIYDHTGGADGFVTNVCFVPEEKLGITILTNNDNQEFFEILRMQILAAYLNISPYKNYSKRSLPGFIEEQKKIADSTKALRARVKDNKPQLPLKNYEGIYNNQLFGNIYISSKGKDLQIKFDNHPGLSASLQYMDGDEWLLTYNSIAYGIFPLKFDIQNSKVVSTSIKVNDFLEYDPYLFTKQ